MKIKKSQLKKLLEESFESGVEFGKSFEPNNYQMNFEEWYNDYAKEKIQDSFNEKQYYVNKKNELNHLFKLINEIIDLNKSIDSELTKIEK